MNDYELKQRNKEQRYLDLSKKHQEKAGSFQEYAEKLSGVMNGQPVLVGHYSEGRHRRDLDKMGNAIRTSISESEKSAYYADKAENMGSRGISSDDPKAIEKITEKIHLLEKEQSELKRISKILHKLNLPNPYTEKETEADSVTKLVECGLTDRDIKLALRNTEIYGKVWKIAKWGLTSLNQNIHRLRKRITDLEDLNKETKFLENIEGDGWKIVFNAEANRVQILFTEKPDVTMITTLKSNGFKWSPSNRAWQRMLNNQGIYKAKEVMGFNLNDN